VNGFTLSPEIRNGYERKVNAQLSFDTLAFVKRLSAAGMESRQAEALAQALNEIVFDKLATRYDLKETELGLQTNLKDLRSDLKESELGLRSDLKELEARLRAELKELELRLTNSLTGRMGAMTAATVAVLGALVTLT
jgi:Protein of unknown function (DUF1640)